MCATNCDRQQTFELPRLDRQLVWLQPLQVYHNYCPLSHALQDFSIHSEVIGRKNKKIMMSSSCFGIPTSFIRL